jgi:hypothetical protein
VQNCRHSFNVNKNRTVNDRPRSNGYPTYYAKRLFEARSQFISQYNYTESSGRMLGKELTERGVKERRSFPIFSNIPGLTWRRWWKPRKPSETVPASRPRYEPGPFQIRSRSSLPLDHDVFLHCLLYFIICWIIFMTQNRGVMSVDVLFSKLITRFWCTFVH